MIEEERSGQATVENRGKRSWKVYGPVGSCERTPRRTLNQLRQLGHVRLVTPAFEGAGNEPGDAQAFPASKTAEAASLETGGESMPKQQLKRNYKDDDTKYRESGATPEIEDIPNIKREFILTPSTDETLYEAVRLFSKATGTNLTNSHFLRIVLKSIAHAMPRLEREASELGQLKRPSNARENQAEREEYERTLASAVSSALRRCPPFGSEPRTKTKKPSR